METSGRGWASEPAEARTEDALRIHVWSIWGGFGDVKEIHSGRFIVRWWRCLEILMRLFVEENDKKACDFELKRKKQGHLTARVLSASLVCVVCVWCVCVCAGPRRMPLTRHLYFAAARRFYVHDMHMTRIFMQSHDHYFESLLEYRPFSFEITGQGLLDAQPIQCPSNEFHLNKYISNDKINKDQ